MPVKTVFARRFLALTLALLMLLSVLPAASADNRPTENEVYQTLMALKSKYPEGMRWTNADTYSWHGASRSWPYTTGYGCWALGYIFSDAAFGNLPCKCIDRPEGGNISFSMLRVGDLVRYEIRPNEYHTVVVLRVNLNSITVVEGNYLGTVHWERTMSRAEVEQKTEYYLTRYPYSATVRPAPDPVTGFVDVDPKAYYYNALVWARNKGIVSGTSETTFSPNDNCDRAQTMTFLWRAKGKPGAASGRNPFSDVPSGVYYTTPVLWAYHAGITSGTSATTFSPLTQVTRQDVVTLLWRAKGSPNPKSTKSPFPDVQNPQSYSYKAILWAHEQGIVTGVPGGTFNPLDTCTRAQMVTILYRAFS